MPRFRLQDGVLLPGRSLLAEQSLVLNDLPPRLVLPLQSSRYDEAQAVVKVGDWVREGQPLSRPSGLLSRPRISPVAARVVDVGEQPVLIAGLGDGAPAVQTRLQSVVLGELQPRTAGQTVPAWRNMSRSDLLEQIAVMGLTGQDGLPLDLECRLLPGQSTLVLHTLECQPGQHTLSWLLQERSSDLALGIELLWRLADFGQLQLHVSSEDREAARQLCELLPAECKVKVETIASFYPAGLARLRAAQVLKHFPDPRRSLAAQGVLVIDPDRLLRAQQRVLHDDGGLLHPLSWYDRESGKTQQVWAPEGAELSWIYQHLRYALSGESVEFPELQRQLLVGGMLDGAPLTLGSVPLLAGQRNLQLWPRSELPVYREDACISCGHCLDVCPVHLSPPRLLHLIEEQRLLEASAIGLECCLDCGICTWVCPSRINIGHMLRKGAWLLREVRHAN